MCVRNQLYITSSTTRAVRLFRQEGQPSLHRQPPGSANRHVHPSGQQQVELPGVQGVHEVWLVVQHAKDALLLTPHRHADKRIVKAPKHHLQWTHLVATGTIASTLTCMAVFLVPPRCRGKVNALTTALRLCPLCPRPTASSEASWSTDSQVSSSSPSGSSSSTSVALSTTEVLHRRVRTTVRTFQSCRRASGRHGPTGCSAAAALGAAAQAAQTAPSTLGTLLGKVPGWCAEMRFPKTPWENVDEKRTCCMSRW